ncbi:MAG TPA: hypothetical protein VM074_10995 [Solimonas sp.]|nr:hypothetical protein [Solimonas sp.]
MKTNAIVGIFLIVLGVIALAYQGLTLTHREKVADIGPVSITKTERNHIPLPPILGALALAGGVMLLVAGRKA